ncbi:sigma-70 family RNA polymerase sigma factor [Amycolatopsis taiwanensis]|uniref:RNA polymerase sigma factor n=1 Tax=Amycolatopsis taiwanensis TaxID=342230 RepID=A0A9W6QZR5_9PSEU|nr:sigma-70 family RNA polymerase sigma factor [Amycolatopsis taiwanensis]GLY66964.1 RNA polymerase principal sigma factor HrdC [Amycolatopsis taiwanensis]
MEATKTRRRAERVAEEHDAVRHYLDGIGRIPLLSAAEEVRLAKRIEAGVYAEELLRQADDGENPPAVDRADLEAVASDGVRAREQMIRANLRLVVAAARKRRAHGLELLDLIQEGNLGLMRAVQKFDYAKGYKFSTYAMWWIRQAIQRGTAYGSRTIRVPEHAADDLAKLDRAGRELVKQLDHDPTVDELAEATGFTAARVAELRQVGRVTASLDTPVGEDGETSLGDLIAGTESQADAEIDRAAAAAQVDKLLRTLSPVEGEIVAYRFGLGDGRPHTLRETAEHVGLTSARVRRLEQRALMQLRDPSSLDLAA